MSADQTPIATVREALSDAEADRIAAAIYVEVADEPLGDLTQRRPAVQQQWRDAVRSALAHRSAPPARDQGLTIEIVDGRLLVSIGVDALMTAVRGGDDWDDETMTIVDADLFATEIAHALEHNEQEDGTTDIHLAIDRAALHAIESGSTAIGFASEEIVYDRDGPR